LEIDELEIKVHVICVAIVGCGQPVGVVVVVVVVVVAVVVGIINGGGGGGGGGIVRVAVVVVSCCWCCSCFVGGDAVGVVLVPVLVLFSWAVLFVVGGGFTVCNVKV
jgi:hypothetical protein